ncbi:S8 family serine peptidase [Clostridium oryzae]|uniref:Serine protease AprX n=1 Tax=Clostridium oryzae TaxID=1450648 RepID=A0A1V4IQS6_9CLOT|nr:S8 family serine peptidase [Clostridium oryzae]OPJ62286.1 serine protease AprX [Clostridium oryzae]
MFFIRNKFDSNLKYCLNNNIYKKYRVNIKCSSLLDSVCKRITSHKGIVMSMLPSINMICAIISSPYLEKLVEYPEIEGIFLDSYAFLCGSSVHAANSINFRGKKYSSGKDIGVALIDSGVYPHEDLQLPNKKIKNFIDLINNYSYPYDDNGHGTFMAGIICGSGISSNDMYKGIAPGSHLYAIKAFNSLGRGFISDIFSGFERILEDAENYNIKVACLPFELLDISPNVLHYFDIYFQKFIDKNIIPIVPSGSRGNMEGSIRGIAILENCITVSGIDTTAAASPYLYSSQGPVSKVHKPNLCAACVDICSLNSNTSYVSQRNGVRLFPPKLTKPYTVYTGTSCSAAFISGLCACLISENSKLRFKDILSLLKLSCTSLDLPTAVQGNGKIDIDKLFPQ